MSKTQASNLLDEQISELKKTISLIEWDIPHIKNSNLRALKEQRLADLRNEVNKLVEEKAVPAIEYEEFEGGEPYAKKKKN